jgi:hypothetical protein
MVSSWNARSLWPLLFQTSQFALRPTVLANGVARSATLQPSGSLYYRMGVPANGEGRLQVTANTLPAALSVTVVRVR